MTVDAKNKFIIRLFNDLFNYLDSIDINKHKEIINFIQIKYLEHKSLKKSNEDFIKIIYNLIIKNLTDYFENILNNYNKFKINNLSFNSYCLFFIYKIILFIYSYYYYIYKIFNDNGNKAILYKNVINNFRRDFINNGNDDDVIKISDINAIKLKELKEINKDLFNKKIISYIILLKEFYNKNTLNDYKDAYITIPQYFGNCWYISMLTGICYSDLSKKLLLSKIGDEANLKKLLETSSKTDKILIKTVNYIIKNQRLKC